MKLFPTTCTWERKLRGNSLTSTDIIEVCCIHVCRMPELTGLQWIECSKCNEWYYIGTLKCSVMEQHVQYLKYSTESMDSALKEVIGRVV